GIAGHDRFGEELAIGIAALVGDEIDLAGVAEEQIAGDLALLEARVGEAGALVADPPLTWGHAAALPVGDAAVRPVIFAPAHKLARMAMEGRAGEQLTQGRLAGERHAVLRGHAGDAEGAAERGEKQSAATAREPHRNLSSRSARGSPPAIVMASAFTPRSRERDSR